MSNPFSSPQNELIERIKKERELRQKIQMNSEEKGLNINNFSPLPSSPCFNSPDSIKRFKPMSTLKSPSEISDSSEEFDLEINDENCTPEEIRRVFALLSLSPPQTPLYKSNQLQNVESPSSTLSSDDFSPTQFFQKRGSSPPHTPLLKASNSNKTNIHIGVNEELKSPDTPEFLKGSSCKNSISSSSLSNHLQDKENVRESQFNQLYRTNSISPKSPEFPSLMTTRLMNPFQNSPDEDLKSPELPPRSKFSFF